MSLATGARSALGLALLCATVAVTLPVEAQCAMCQTALTQSPEGRALSVQLNKAILLLMAAPYLVAATFALVFFRERLHRAMRPVLQRSRWLGSPATRLREVSSPRS